MGSSTKDHFGPANPILRVSDLGASVRYYVDKLGFAVDWNNDIIACVGRDRCHVFLSCGDQGHLGAWLWVGVEDVVSLHAELLHRNALIRNPPSNFPWALEMQVADPDGNILRIGSAPLPGEPWGVWLDMNGARWQLDEHNVWRRLDSPAEPPV